MKKNKSPLDYIGSKQVLAPKICNLIEKHTGIVDETSFTEIFAGTAAVSRWLLHNRNLRTIITNDFEPYSVATCIATMRQISINKSIYDRFNSLPGYQGFVTINGSPTGSTGRKFFTTKNAMKIDGIKFHINNMLYEEVITIDQAFKLAGDLTIAADKVSNTASVYGAFLKKFKKTALRELYIEPQIPPTGNTRVWNLMLDANDAIMNLTGDILYIDPPYNQRQYGNNYHVLNWIADLWAEKKYVPRGITGVHKNWQRSQYCQRKKVAERISHLIKNAKFDYIVFSYNNKGLLDTSQLLQIFETYCNVLEIKEIEYKNFKADKSRTYNSDRTIEYIFICQKRQRKVQMKL